MSSRKEEKERLRHEREQAEQAARASESRRKRLAIVLGGVLAVAVAVIVVLAVTGGDDSGGGGENPDAVALPAKQTDDLQAAVKAANCVFAEPEDEGNQHLGTNDESFDDYKTNPPTSGTHRPVAAPDGIFAPGNSPDAENWVHSLEHGRVIFQYKPGTPENRRGQLETLMNEKFDDQPEGYKTSIMENNTEMSYEVSALAWGRYLGCEKFTDASFDALRAFRNDFVDSEKAPEPDFPWPFTGT